ELNQGNLETFYTFCFKYQCSSSEPDTIEVNSATKKWNNMLGENIGPAIDRAAQAAATQMKLVDTIWQNHDAALYKALGDAMSTQMRDAIRVTSGYDQDLFCGSGSTSGWKDPNKPGQGQFACGNIRVVVDKVEA